MKKAPLQALFLCSTGGVPVFFEQVCIVLSVNVGA